MLSENSIRPSNITCQVAVQCPPWPHWGTPDPALFPPCCARKFCTHLLRVFQNITERGVERQVRAKGCSNPYIALHFMSVTHECSYVQKVLVKEMRAQDWVTYILGCMWEKTAVIIRDPNCNMSAKGQVVWMTIISCIGKLKKRKPCLT